MITPLMLTAGNLLVCLAGLIGLGAPTVDNPSDPPAREVWRFEERWRVGGDDDDVLFGWVVDAETDGTGNLYLLDRQLCQVVVLTPEGEFRRTLSREGEGPGEIRLPHQVIAMEPGCVGILQGYPGRVVRIGTGDEPIGVIRLGGSDPAEGGSHIASRAGYRDGHLIVQGSKMTFDAGDRKSTRYVASIDDDGAEIRRYAEKDATNDIKDHRWRIDEAKGFFAAHRWALGDDGALFIAPHRDRYEIHEIAADGELRRIIGRDFAPRKRTEADLEQLKGGYSTNDPLMEFEFHLEAYEPPIGEISYHPDGTLWVVNCNSLIDLPEGVALRYDVFDSDGRLTEEVSIALPFNRDQDELHWIDTTRIVRVTGVNAAAEQASRAEGFKSGNDGEDGQEGSSPAEETILQVMLYERVD